MTEVNIKIIHAKLYVIGELNWVLTYFPLLNLKTLLNKTSTDTFII